MKNPSKTKKTLLVALILNILVWGIYGFVFFKIRSQNEHVSGLLGEANNDIRKDETLRTIKNSLSENKDFISHLDSYFVAKDGIVNFIEMLEDKGRESGVLLSIGSVSVEQDPKVKEDIKEILRLKVDASGSWKDVTYFLSVLENLPYVTEVNNVSFTRNGGGSGLLFDEEKNPDENNTSLGWKAYFEFTVLKLK